MITPCGSMSRSRARRGVDLKLTWRRGIDDNLSEAGPTGREDGAVNLWNNVRCESKPSPRRAVPMSVFHAPAHCASHSERGARALTRLVEQVNALRAHSVTGGGLRRAGARAPEPVRRSRARGGGRDAGASGCGPAVRRDGGAAVPLGAAQSRDVHECGGSGRGASHAVPMREGASGGAGGPRVRGDPGGCRCGALTWNPGKRRGV